MNGFPYLTVLGAIPLVGSVAVTATPKGKSLLAKQIALLTTLVTLVWAIVVAVKFKTGGPRFQFVESHAWIKAFHINYAVGVDGIALVLILMAVVLMPVVLLAAWHDADAAEAEGRRSVRSYFALFLLLETMMIGVFAATDLFLFYVFFEVMLIPMYFLIGSFGGPQRSYAAVKFLLYSLFGGLFMLAALIGLYVASGNHLSAPSFDFITLSNAVSSGQLALGAGLAKALFLGFFVAFAVKAPLFPFHTWLPDAAAEATPGSAVLLVGVLDKVGTFGMLRYCLELFPGASKYFTPLVIGLAIVGTIYGALLAIGQTDIKRLIAYTSISHFGLITLGVFAMTSAGQSGASLYMVNHGLSTGALFIVAGFLISRRGSQLIDDYGGVNKVAPVLAGTFLLAGLSSLALPGMSSFVSEFLVLVGTFERYKAVSIVATAAIILAALYILWLYQRTMTGPLKAGLEGIKDLRVREVAAVAPLIALIIGLGVYPKPLLDIVNPAVNNTLSHVQKQDPAPVVPAAAAVQPEGTTK
jgi:NADH-quinone oxidoreductase subunit M